MERSVAMAACVKYRTSRGRQEGVVSKKRVGKVVG